MNIEIANRLVTLRKKYGYSQEALAEKLGISRQAISKWERAESSPDTDNLIALSKLYNISLDVLLEADDESIENEKYAKQFESTPNNPEKRSSEHSGSLESTKASRWFRFPYPLVVVLIYCLLSALTNRWGVYWYIFPSIPIYYLVVTFFHLKEKGRVQNDDL